MADSSIVAAERMVAEQALEAVCERIAVAHGLQPLREAPIKFTDAGKKQLDRLQAIVEFLDRVAAILLAGEPAAPQESDGSNDRTFSPHRRGRRKSN